MMAAAIDHLYFRCRVFLMAKFLLLIRSQGGVWYVCAYHLLDGENLIVLVFST